MRKFLQTFLDKFAITPAPSFAELAQEAYDRGDTVFVSKFAPDYTKFGADLAQTIADVQAIGWTLAFQLQEGTGMQRTYTLTFQRAA